MWTDTDHPSITEYGSVVYSAGVIETDSQGDNQKLFTDIVKRMIAKPSVEVDTPDGVDFTVYKGNGRYRICLLNSLPVEVRGVTVRIKALAGKLISNVHTLVGGCAKYTMESNGDCTVRLDILKTYENIICDVMV